MSTIITALAVLVFIGLIVALLMYVNARDSKRDALKKMEASDRTDIP